MLYLTWNPNQSPTLNYEAGRGRRLPRSDLLPVSLFSTSSSPCRIWQLDKQITHITTAFPTECLQHPCLAVGSASKIRWDLGWEVIKSPNKFSYMLTLSEEVIAESFQVSLGIFRILDILKGTIHFLFAKKKKGGGTFLTKEAAVTYFSGDERTAYTCLLIILEKWRRCWGKCCALNVRMAIKCMERALCLQIKQSSCRQPQTG